MDPQKHNYQNLFSKWLLATVLFLSFFIFSGLVIQTRALPDPPKTTLMQCSHKLAAKSITYKRALTHSPARLNILSFFTKCSINMSEVHNKLVKVQIISYRALNVANPYTAFFYQHKTIPQNTSDVPAIALV